MHKTPLPHPPGRRRKDERVRTLGGAGGRRQQDKGRSEVKWVSWNW